jgi:hypothetical protein
MRGADQGTCHGVVQRIVLDAEDNLFGHTPGQQLVPAEIRKDTVIEVGPLVKNSPKTGVQPRARRCVRKEVFEARIVLYTESGRQLNESPSQLLLINVFAPDRRFGRTADRLELGLDVLYLVDLDLTALWKEANILAEEIEVDDHLAKFAGRCGEQTNVVDVPEVTNAIEVAIIAVEMLEDNL